ncbi:HNH endonuclease, partial [Nocardiopsis sp. HNM0947]|nr:HNH endonuclease [Nocardiopsis coralli]
FTAPYGTTEKTNTPDANGAGADGTEAASGGTGTNGADIGLIPAGEAVTSRYGRTYDALISAMGFAHGHHGHTHTTTGTNGTGKGKGNATGGPAAGADAGADPDGDTDGDGPGGFASGGGNFASGDSAVAADSSADADGSASGGGCSQPPGTKAVINITV